MPCLGQHLHFYYILFRTKDKMHTVLFLSHLLAIAIKQIHIRAIAFVYLECKQISSSKSDQLLCRYYKYPVHNQDRLAQNYIPCLFVLVELLDIFFLILDFLLLHLNILFPMNELFSVCVMSLRAYITQALRDNNLVTRAFRSGFQLRKNPCAIVWSARDVTPRKEQQGGLTSKRKICTLFLNNFSDFANCSFSHFAILCFKHALPD